MYIACLANCAADRRRASLDPPADPGVLRKGAWGLEAGAIQGCGRGVRAAMQGKQYVSTAFAFAVI
jgi:hypothetical protein